MVLKPVRVVLWKTKTSKQIWSVVFVCKGGPNRRQTSWKHTRTNAKQTLSFAGTVSRTCIIWFWTIIYIAFVGRRKRNKQWPFITQFWIFLGGEGVGGRNDNMCTARARKLNKNQLQHWGLSVNNNIEEHTEHKSSVI